MDIPGKYIITGPPGSGKSTLCAELARRGYWCARESARKEAAHSQDMKSPSFNQKLISRGEKLHEKAPSESVCFFDRGLPDVVAYARVFGDSNADAYSTEVRAYPYSNPVFFLPYWRQIYHDDGVRDVFTEKLQEIERELFRVYTELGYTICMLPRDTLEERVETVLLVVDP